MLAYPGGGSRGASSATLIVVLIAAIVLWRRRQRTILALLVMPLGVALAVAAARRYPYGGEARIMQYVAPAICLMAGLGLSTILQWIPRPDRRSAAIRGTALILATVGIVAMLDEFRHPYRAIYDDQAREFARRFWPELARHGDFACLQWDFGVKTRKAPPARTSIYLCNQLIYCPRPRLAAAPRSALDGPLRPFRCVVFDEALINSPQATAWLESIQTSYELRKREDLAIPTIGLKAQSSARCRCWTVRRFNHLLAGASWIGEYGNPDVPEEWAFIRTFSPYHMVQRFGEVFPHAVHDLDP